MGRHEGFEEFVRAGQQGLMRTAYLLTQDGQQAEDLLRTVLGRAGSRWRAISHGGDPVAEVRRLLVRQYLEKQGDRDRATVVLRRYEQLSDFQTASALDCSVAEVKSAMERLDATTLMEDAPIADISPDAPRRAYWKPAAIGGAALVVLAAAAFGVTHRTTQPAPKPVAKSQLSMIQALPAKLPDPIVYGYLDWCQKYEPQPTGECAQWKVVTDKGVTYRVPQAQSVYLGEVDRMESPAGPLAISADGHRIAYIDPATKRFAVRDLTTGQAWATPIAADRKTFSRFDRTGQWLAAGQKAINLQTAEVRDLPSANMAFLDSDGTPATRDKKNRLRIGAKSVQLPGKQIDPVSQLSGDGTKIAVFTGTKTGGKQNYIMEGPDHVQLVDVGTGKVLHTHPVKLSKDYMIFQIGAWISDVEVVVPAYPMASGSGGFHAMPFAINVETGEVRELPHPNFKGNHSVLSLPGLD